MTATHQRPVGTLQRIAAVALALAALAAGPVARAVAQPSVAQVGEVVPRDVREMYDRGLQFLAASQTENGTWTGGEMRAGMTAGMETAARMDPTWADRGEQGPGVTALGLLVMLASGEDPNFGVYSGHVRKALRSLLKAQDARTGHFAPSMYHHGFAMLALAESYGAVDERNLWTEGEGTRSIGQALELAVRAAITAQKSNPFNAWRYGPGSKDADTSVSGAVIVGLLAARNAGIEVPTRRSTRRSPTSVDDAPDGRGLLRRAGGPADAMARTPIANLAYALARRKDHPEYRLTLTYLVQRIEEPPGVFLEYAATTRRRPSSRGTSTRGRGGTRSSSASSRIRSCPTAASAGGSARRSPPRSRSSRWRSIIASYPSTNDEAVPHE